MDNSGELIRSNIRAILREKHLTMADVDKIIGRPKALSNFMCGAQSNPSASSLFVFAKALDVPIHKIFGESIEDVSLSGKTINLLLKILGQLRNNEKFFNKNRGILRIETTVLGGDG